MNIYTHMYIYIYMYVCMYVCMYVYMYLCIHVYRYICIYVCMCLPSYLPVYLMSSYLYIQYICATHMYIYIYSLRAIVFLSCSLQVASAWATAEDLSDHTKKWKATLSRYGVRVLKYVGTYVCTSVCTVCTVCIHTYTICIYIHIYIYGDTHARNLIACPKQRPASVGLFTIAQGTF